MNNVSWFRLTCVVALHAFLVSPNRASGATIALTPDADTYVTSADSTSSNNTHNVQGIKVFDEAVWSNGWIQFDLSSVTEEIVGVHLELYQIAEGNGLALSIPVALVDVPDGVTRIDETTFSRRRAIRGPNDVSDSLVDDYQDFRMYNIGLDFSIPAASANGSYYASGSASAAGISLLEGRRTNANVADQYALFNLDVAAVAGGGTRFFDDKETSGDFPTGFAPRLVLETVPEPSSVALFGLGVAGFLSGLGRSARVVKTS
jgi:hypothetical protein